jgi:chlorophyllide a reductase subunit Y
MAGKARFDEMKSFFSGVGEGDAAGIWRGVPPAHPQFRDHQSRKLAQRARQAKNLEAPTGC